MQKHGGYHGDKKGIIDFSVNLNAVGLPDTVGFLLKESIHQISSYPDPYYKASKEALSLRLNLPINAIIMGNGATELIYLFARTIKAKTALILQPTFTEYERAFQQTGTKCFHYHLTEEEGFTLPIDAFIKVIALNQPDAVVICNPNNPTGSYINKENIQEILQTIKGYGGYLMLDESFAAFSDIETSVTLKDSENLFVIRSMTKYYALAGLRLGYGVGHPSLIHALNAYKEPWTLNILAATLVKVLLRDEVYREKTKVWFNEERKYLEDQLNQLSYIRVFPTYSNFFLCKCLRIEASLIQEKLLDLGIYIRTCEDFIGLQGDYIRLVIRTHDENVKLIQALKQISKTT